MFSTEISLICWISFPATFYFPSAECLRPVSYTHLSGASTGQTAETEKAAVTNAAAEVLQEADFTPAELGTTLTNLPAATPTDPRIEQAQRLLSEAVAAIQFADYPTATRLLNQVHQLQPGYAPAPVSYTHLDVYKRQVHGDCAWRFAGADHRVERGAAV